MSHWVTGKEALEVPEIREYVRWALRDVFSDGYSFENPPCKKGRPQVQILVPDSSSRREILLESTMRMLGIEASRDAWFTWTVEAEFHAAIRDFTIPTKVDKGRCYTASTATLPEQHSSLSTSLWCRRYSSRSQ
mgnify:CR=1 FL=1